MVKLFILDKYSYKIYYANNFKSKALGNRYRTSPRYYSTCKTKMEFNILKSNVKRILGNIMMIIILLQMHVIIMLIYNKHIVKIA